MFLIPVGAFFWVSHNTVLDMDKDLQRIIHHALEDARARGKGYASEPMLILLAVRAVRKARPDMTASEALIAINTVRQL